MQRQEQIAVFAGECLHRKTLASHVGNNIEHFKVATINCDALCDCTRLGFDDRKRFGGLSARNNYCARLDDSRFGVRDLGHGVTETLGVVDRNRRKDGHVTIGDVGGIPLATHANLEHQNVNRSVGKNGETQHRKRFEEGELGVAGGL